MDRKGILWFLLITFGLTYAIEIPLLLSGFSLVGLISSAGQYIFLPIMVMPTIGALITTRFITKEGWRGLGIRFGSWKPYLFAALAIPFLFIVIYLVTWGMGWGAPDWELSNFKSLFTASGMEVPQMPDERLVLLAVFIATLTGGTLVNWLWCTGEEIGWRGFLLPRLMPLGKLKAYLLLGVIWSAWHWPLLWAGFTYGQAKSIPAILVFTVLTTSLGIYLNELTLRYKSALLAGWVHGVFNTQKMGMWFLLFPQVSVFLGGYAGLVGLVVWCGLAYWEWRKGVARALPATT